MHGGADLKHRPEGGLSRPGSGGSCPAPRGPWSPASPSPPGCAGASGLDSALTLWWPKEGCFPLSHSSPQQDPGSFSKSCSPSWSFHWEPQEPFLWKGRQCSGPASAHTCSSSGSLLPAPTGVPRAPHDPVFFLSPMSWPLPPRLRFHSLGSCAASPENSQTWCSGQDSGPSKDVHVGPVNVTLFGKGVFADVIELRIWRCDHPGLEWP